MEETNTSAIEVGTFEFPEKEVQTDHYEIMVLLTTAETEQDAASVFESVTQAIQSFEGTLTHQENLGNRSLAYTVAGARNGYYFVAEFDLPKLQLAQLNEKLRIRKDITRFLIIKKRIPTPEEVAENDRVQQKIETRRQAKKASTETVNVEERVIKAKAPIAAPASAAPATPAPASAPTQEPKTAETVEQPKAPRKSLKDIDKEIEKLLSDDIDV